MAIIIAERTITFLLGSPSRSCGAAACRHALTRKNGRACDWTKLDVFRTPFLLDSISPSPLDLHRPTCSYPHQAAGKLTSPTSERSAPITMLYSGLHPQTRIKCPGWLTVVIIRQIRVCGKSPQAAAQLLSKFSPLGQQQSICCLDVSTDSVFFARMNSTTSFEVLMILPD